MKEYTVSLSCSFEAESPEDAVRMMQEWMIDSGRLSGFAVTDEDNGYRLIDGEDV